MGRRGGDGVASGMPSCQEVAPELFRDGGVILLADVHCGGEVERLPDHGTAVKPGTSWLVVGM